MYNMRYNIIVIFEMCGSNMYYICIFTWDFLFHWQTKYYCTELWLGMGQWIHEYIFDKNLTPGNEIYFFVYFS